jgi:BMFP domain-containing protein YqiC
MPVTAKLSKLFYERLGEEVTNELVDWFNAVDATYRGELKEFNELNFARFDAKLEQRLAGLEARLTAKLDASVAQHAFAQLDSKIEQRFAEMRTSLEKGLKDQTRWFILVWSALLVPIIGLWMRR